MAPKCKSSKAGNSDMPKRSREVLPVSEWKGQNSQLSKDRTKLYAEVAKIYHKNKSSTCEIVKKEKEICASFAVASQTVKVTATVCGKCLVKMAKALNLYNKIFWDKERGRNHMHITFIALYCYNCSILLLVVVNLLLCLIYKLNFIIGMYF